MSAFESIGKHYKNSNQKPKHKRKTLWTSIYLVGNTKSLPLPPPHPYPTLEKQSFSTPKVSWKQSGKHGFVLNGVVHILKILYKFSNIDYRLGEVTMKFWYWGKLMPDIFPRQVTEATRLLLAGTGNYTYLTTWCEIYDYSESGDQSSLLFYLNKSFSLQIDRWTSSLSLRKHTLWGQIINLIDRWY